MQPRFQLRTKSCIVQVQFRPLEQTGSRHRMWHPGAAAQPANKSYGAPDWKAKHPFPFGHGMNNLNKHVCNELLNGAIRRSRQLHISEGKNIMKCSASASAN